MYNTKITILVKKPGKKWVRTVIPNELSAMQKIVGGYIEVYRTPVPDIDDVVIVCNEDGKLRHLAYNTRLFGEDFVGTIFMCGVYGEEFDSIPQWLDDLVSCIPILDVDRP